MSKQRLNITVDRDVIVWRLWQGVVRWNPAPDPVPEIPESPTGCRSA